MEMRDPSVFLFTCCCLFSLSVAERVVRFGEEQQAAASTDGERQMRNVR